MRYNRLINKRGTQVPPSKGEYEMKYRINYLHKSIHQTMWREEHEIVTLEKLQGVLSYMEKNSESYR